MDTTLTTYFFITLGILWLLLVVSFTNKTYPMEKKLKSMGKSKERECTQVKV